MRKGHLLDGNKDVSLGAEAQVFGVVEKVSAVALSDTLLHVDFAVVVATCWAFALPNGNNAIIVSAKYVSLFIT